MVICKDITESSCCQRCSERVFNDAAKKMMSTGGVHSEKTVPENRQILTTQNSALQCSYEQETDDS